MPTPISFASLLAAPLAALEQRQAFIDRHIGPDNGEIAGMLQYLGVASLDELIAQTLPADILLDSLPDLPTSHPEHEALAILRGIAARNVIKKSLIGMGYYDTYTPTVILRNVLENPGWYTAYTPYQAEVAQGRLEALLTFQQMVTDLTGLEVANASLLDEATAAAEAMAMARRISKVKSNRFFVDENCFPQTIDVVRTRAGFFGFELVCGPAGSADQHEVFGALLQYPDQYGEIADPTSVIARLKAKGAIAIVACDLMALVLLKAPGDMGADIALGSTQRFGVPLGFGGPHAAFFATRKEYVRNMPGRVIGVSRDSRGKPCYRMTLQTREQHIRREKATSNICTSQVLLANMAAFYAVYHGPQGLSVIAARIHRLAAMLAVGLRQGGFAVSAAPLFDTVRIQAGTRTETIFTRAGEAGYNLRRISADELGISIDETTSGEDLRTLFDIFGVAVPFEPLEREVAAKGGLLPAALLRRDAILTHPVFNRCRSEHQMLRYLKKLQNRDLALDHSMIPLGSCTMKLNAASEMLPITWPEFTRLHPFAPRDQAQGSLQMIDELADYLRVITGFDAVSMQPNSGAQGEYAGLVAIRCYHASRGEAHRDICLIPKSAHGTNPASAHMCGLQVVIVATDEHGNVDIDDLRVKAEQHAGHLAALMITYPSTHGVFEEGVREMCEIAHRYGGQVYMDGANLNAQVAITSPGRIGADVTHMNLHKTFAIPHGGGGPGMGPIAMAAHLAPFMADHVVSPTGNDSRPNKGQGAVSAAPFGSASILPISWMYITMMGAAGLRRATQVAILNANYLAERLGSHYPVLYTGANGRVGHECILDIRPIKAASGISEVDIAKRLMDYGFHAPTMSFPVAGTIMVEPTESEDRGELDRFIAAMLAIREEISEVENGTWPADDNPLVNAPHTQSDLFDEWRHPYSREKAAFPLDFIRQNKFWPSVNRIDDVYGDRNLFFGCLPPESGLQE